MTFLVAATAFLVAACLGGQTIHRRLDPHATGPERLAWSWLIGQGLVSAVAALAVIAGWPLAAALGFPLLIAVTAFLIQIGKARKRKARHGGWSALLSVATAAGLLALLIVWRAPGLGFDGLAIWGHKARLLVEMGRLPIDTLVHPLSISMHPEYPLHVPLLGAVLGSLLEAWGQGWSDRLLPFLAATDLTAISLLLASALEGERRQDEPRDRGRNARRAVLLVGGLLTPIVWRELPEGKADLTLALFLLASILALSRWLRSGETRALYLAAIAGGLGAFTKQEGAVWLGLSFSLAFLLAPGPRRRLMVPALLALSIATPWHFFRLGIGLRTEPFTFESAQLERLPTLVKAMGLEWLDLSHWGLLWLLAWPAAVLTLIRAVAALRKEPKESAIRASSFVALSLICGAVAISAFFLTTPHEIGWHLSTALDRLFLPWWPVALMVVATQLEASLSTVARTATQR